MKDGGVCRAAPGYTWSAKYILLTGCQYTTKWSTVIIMICIEGCQLYFPYKNSTNIVTWKYYVTSS